MNRQQYKLVGRWESPCECGHESCKGVSWGYTWRWLVPATEMTVSYYEMAQISGHNFWGGENRWNYWMEYIA